METTYTELTERQLRFCENVALGMKSKDAYAVSGYRTKNPADARRCAKRLMEREPVREEIERLKSGGASRRTPKKRAVSPEETSEKLAENLSETDLINLSIVELRRALEDPKLPAVKRVDTVKQMGKLMEMRGLKEQQGDGVELLKAFIEDCKSGALEGVGVVRPVDRR